MINLFLKVKKINYCSVKQWPLSIFDTKCYGVQDALIEDLEYIQMCVLCIWKHRFRNTMIPMTIVCRSALIQDMKCTQIHILSLRTWLVQDAKHCRPCHQGVVNGGCVVVGKPHPSHPFTMSHHMVYEIARAIRKKISMDKISADEKTMFARWRGWLFIPSYESICVGFWRFLEGSLSSQWSSIFNEGLSLKFFIQYSWVDGGGNFIQRSFQTLP